MKRELLLGGLGGLTPIIVSLLAQEAGDILKNFDWVVFFGWLVRGALLFFIGALFVYLNSEDDRKKAFQIGVMAPALIQGYLTAADLRQVREAASNPAQPLADSTMVGFNFGAGFFLSDAFASEAGSGLNGQSDFASRFWRGLTGSSTYNFAIVATLPSRESAVYEAERYLNFEVPCVPRIYRLSSEQYVVQLGGNLLPRQAQECVSAARVANMSPDAFVFSSLSPRSERGRIPLPDRWGTYWRYEYKINNLTAPGMMRLSRDPTSGPEWKSWCSFSFRLRAAFPHRSSGTAWPACD